MIKMQRRNIGAAIVSSVLIIAAVILSVHSYTRIDKLKLQVAEKELESDKNYNLLQQKSQQSNDTMLSLDKRFINLEQKYDVTEKQIQDMQLNFAKLELLNNTNNLIQMQFKHIIGMTAEQLKITQDAVMALSNLQDINDKIDKFPNNNWNELKQALNEDIANLKLQPSNDNTILIDKIDKSLQQLEAVEFIKIPNDDKTSLNKNYNWLQTLYYNISKELLSLIKIQKINNPQAVLLDINEQWFIKQHIKLLLTQCKLSIYNRNQVEFNKNLQQIQEYSNKFIEKNDKSSNEFNYLISNLQLVIFAKNININKTVQAVNKINN